MRFKHQINASFVLLLRESCSDRLFFLFFFYHREKAEAPSVRVQARRRVRGRPGACRRNVLRVSIIYPLLPPLAATFFLAVLHHTLHRHRPEGRNNVLWRPAEAAVTILCPYREFNTPTLRLIMCINRGK